jgi:Fe2+ or Zn2+ uptake regulation protein
MWYKLQARTTCLTGSEPKKTGVVYFIPAILTNTRLTVTIIKTITIINNKMNKKTRQKEAILATLKQTSSHPTADWVYNQVKKEIPNISLGTVYRNLRQLSAQGQVQELKLCDTLSRFDARLDNHYHFRCEQCGSVLDVDMPVEKELNRKAERETGFRVTHHVMEFYGLCDQCQTGAQPLNRGITGLYA